MPPLIGTSQHALLTTKQLRPRHHLTVAVNPLNNPDKLLCGVHIVLEQVDNAADGAEWLFLQHPFVHDPVLDDVVDDELDEFRLVLVQPLVREEYRKCFVRRLGIEADDLPHECRCVSCSRNFTKSRNASRTASSSSRSASSQNSLVSTCSIVARWATTCGMVPFCASFSAVCTTLLIGRVALFCCNLASSIVYIK